MRLARGIQCLLLLLTTAGWGWAQSKAPGAADGPCVVAGQGFFRIHVGTGGLFGGFAHDHSIEAQKITGCAVVDSNDLRNSSIKLVFTTANIKVIDPKESAKDRAAVQKTMETDVLRISEYPEVKFESTGIERRGSTDQFSVRGNLTIRGKTMPVTIPLVLVRAAAGAYRASGKYNFKQSAFGIKPVSLAGGTVKVKDELETEFEIDLK